MKILEYIKSLIYDEIPEVELNLSKPDPEVLISIAEYIDSIDIDKLTSEFDWGKSVSIDFENRYTIGEVLYRLKISNDVISRMAVVDLNSYRITTTTLDQWLCDLEKSEYQDIRTILTVFKKYIKPLVCLIITNDDCEYYTRMYWGIITTAYRLTKLVSEITTEE